MPSGANKAAWIATLTEAAPPPARVKIECFLRGLSGDELEYLGAFLGSCTLENFNPFEASHYKLSQAVQIFDSQRPVKGLTPDREHKMFVALELFRRAATAAGSASAAQAAGTGGSQSEDRN